MGLSFFFINKIFLTTILPPPVSFFFTGEMTFIYPPEGLYLLVKTVILKEDDRGY